MCYIVSVVQSSSLEMSIIMFSYEILISKAKYDVTGHSYQLGGKMSKLGKLNMIELT